MIENVSDLSKLVDLVKAGDYEGDPEEIAEVFLRSLENNDNQIRSKALSGLSALITEQSVKSKLITIAQSVMRNDILQTYGLRKDALVVFAGICEQIEDKSALQFSRTSLVNYLDDQRMEIRSLCAKLLGLIGESSDVFVIVRQFVRDVNVEVQLELMEALSKIDSEAAAKRILEEIANFNRDMESNAIYKTNWYGVVRVLGEHLQRGNEWVVQPLLAIAENNEFEGSPASTAKSILSV